MKRLTLLAMMVVCALCAMAMQARADDDQRVVFVATGQLDEAMLAKPENAAILQSHIAYLGKLWDEGHLVAAGPFTDSSGQGLIVLKAASMEEAEALLKGDPSMQAGLIKPVSLHPFYMAFTPDHKFTMDEFAQMMAAGGAPNGGDSSMGSGDMSQSHSASGETAESSEGMPVMTPGDVSFMQIPSPDAAANGEFYRAVFGWEVTPMDAGGQHMTFFTAPGQHMMGEFSTESKPAAAMTGPVFFINTGSVKEMLPKVTAAGGKIYQEEMALPEDWGHIAIIGDVAGNAVGIWSTGE